MNVTVNAISGVPPEQVFYQPAAHDSADGAWTLATTGCRQTGMSAPVTCEGTIRSNTAGSPDWAVGRITRAATFQPWIGRRSRAAWGKNGRIIIGDPTSQTIRRGDVRRIGSRALIGHQELDRLLVAGHRTVALLDHDGQVISSTRFGRHQSPLIGGFSVEGELYIQLVQPGPFQPATLEGFDVRTGDGVVGMDAATVHDLIDQAMKVPWPTKSHTDSARRSLWGGWWMGRVGLTPRLEDQSMTFDVRIPTGETCELFGKTAALVTRHRINVTVEA